MYTFQRRLLFLVLVSSLATSTPVAHADRYYTTYYSDCLSWYAIYKLAKQSLPELQTLDPSISLWKVMSVIRSSGVCVTTETANQSLADYAESLLSVNQTTNTPPQITGIPNASGMEGVFYSFTPQATDPDGDSLTFQIVNRPTWAAFSSTTGTLSGNPGYTDAGSYSNIQISVSDSRSSASLSAFSITISDNNRAPVISGTPLSIVQEGSSYDFSPTAVDADGDKLTFSISGLPRWASFNPATGTLEGTPDFADAGSYINIIISASDGKATASLGPFNINVENYNRPPSISGTADTSIPVGGLFSFTPLVSDPDGDSLSFSVVNLPAWISFNSTNGSLTGTPENTDIGSYGNIIITVSDGTASTSLIPLTVVVNGLAETTASASLSWEIPTSRTDGSPLVVNEIEGYRIYMGSSSEDLGMVVDLNDYTVTRYSVTGLSSGSYYFSVTTYDTDGNESPFSNIVMKEVL